MTQDKKTNVGPTTFTLCLPMHFEKIKKSPSFSSHQNHSTISLTSHQNSLDTPFTIFNRFAFTPLTARTTQLSPPLIHHHSIALSLDLSFLIIIFNASQPTKKSPSSSLDNPLDQSSSIQSSSLSLTPPLNRVIHSFTQLQRLLHLTHSTTMPHPHHLNHLLDR